MRMRDRPHKRRDRCVLHDVIHEGKISRARESLYACGKEARSLHSEMRKLSFVAGWSRAKPKKGLVKLASRGLFLFCLSRASFFVVALPQSSERFQRS
jgi:hypothetical protein